MTDLSTDELTILMIAAQGESMMAIGHWKQTIESLVAKGYLQSRGGDNFNCVITPAGRAACEKRDQEDMQAWIGVTNRLKQEGKIAADGSSRTLTPADISTTKRCPHCGGVLG